MQVWLGHQPIARLKGETPARDYECNDRYPLGCRHGREVYAACRAVRKVAGAFFGPGPYLSHPRKTDLRLKSLRWSCEHFPLARCRRGRVVRFNYTCCGQAVAGVPRHPGHRAADRNIAAAPRQMTRCNASGPISAARASHRRLSFHLRCAVEQLASGTA
jgi:hypothetical protein